MRAGTADRRGRGAAPGRAGAALLLGLLLAGGAQAAPHPEEETQAPAAQEEEAGPPLPSGAPPLHVGVEPRDVRRAAEAATRPVHPPRVVVWGGHVAMGLAPVGTLVGAHRVGGASLLQVGGQTLGAMLLGSVPARLAYLYANPNEPRWREVDVALLGVSLLLTPPAAALGAWGSQQLLLGGNVRPGRAYLGALGGAAAGHLLGLALSGLLERMLPEPALPGLRYVVALGLVGTGASFGQMWLGGGPLR